MLILTLFFAILLLGSYLLFRKKSQSNILIGSASLLISDLVVGKVGNILLETLEKNGWNKDNLTSLVIYVVLIIITWGLIYAVLANFYFRALDNSASIVSAIAALIFTLAIAMPLCFLLSNYTDSNREPICQLCSKISTFTTVSSKKATALVPENLKEVYSLPENSRITIEDKIGKKSMLNLINGERIKQGKNVLIEDTELDNLAQIYAQSMVSSLRFSHLDAYNNGPEERANSQKVIYTYLGENLAIAPDIETAHNSLMNSETHRRNILSDSYHKVGLASYLISTGSIIVVEEFSD